VVAFVEQDKYCQKVLKKHWADVPIINDIRDYRHGDVSNTVRNREVGNKSQNRKRGRVEQVCEANPKLIDDSKITTGEKRHGEGSVITDTTEQGLEGPTGKGLEGPTGKGVQGNIPRPAKRGNGPEQERTKTEKPVYGRRAIDLLTGGFPCQPFSVAGKRKGKEDDRYLWPELLRVIQEAKPRWIIGENVPGIINMGLETTVLDLEGEGYEVELLVLSACGIGSWHKRDRVWIVAHSECGRRNSRSDNAEERENIKVGSSKEDRQLREVEGFRVNKGGPDVSDTDSRLCRGGRTVRQGGEDEKRGVYIKEEGEEAYDIRSKVVGCDSLRGKKEGDVSDTDTERLQGHGEGGGQFKSEFTATESGKRRQGEMGQEWLSFKPKLGDMADGLSAQLGKLGMIWDSEPDIPRVAIGIKDRVKKLKALGNAIVPQCVMPIMWAIREIDDYEENRRGNKGREIG